MSKSLPATPIAAPASGVDRILRVREVVARVGLSRATLWRYVRAGQFPSPRRLGVNAVGWLEREVTAWIASRTPTRAPAVEPASAPGTAR